MSYEIIEKIIPEIIDHFLTDGHSYNALIEPVISKSDSTPCPDTTGTGTEGINTTSNARPSARVLGSRVHNSNSESQGLPLLRGSDISRSNTNIVFNVKKIPIRRREGGAKHREPVLSEQGPDPSDPKPEDSKRPFEQLKSESTRKESIRSIGKGRRLSTKLKSQLKGLRKASIKIKESVAGLSKIFVECEKAQIELKEEIASLKRLENELFNEITTDSEEENDSEENAFKRLKPNT